MKGKKVKFFLGMGILAGCFCSEISFAGEIPVATSRRVQGASKSEPVKLEKLPEWKSAKRAAEDGLWDVAELKLKEIDAKDGLSPQDRGVLSLRMAEVFLHQGKVVDARRCLIRPETQAIPDAKLWNGLLEAASGEYMKAYDILNEYHSLPNLTDSQRAAAIWSLAQISTKLERWDKAKEELSVLLERAKDVKNKKLRTAYLPYQTQARLLLAEGSLSQNNAEEAKRILEEISSKDRELSPYWDILEARAELLSGNPVKSLSILGKMLEGEMGKLPKEIQAMAILAASEAEIAQNLSEAAQDRLINFIESNPSSGRLAEAFFLLENSNAFSEPEVIERLESWLAAQETSPERSILTAYWLSKIYRQRGEVARAQALSEEMIKKYPKSPVIQLIGLNEVSQLVAAGKIVEARQLLEKLDNSYARVLLESAQLAFREAKFDKAAREFTQVARMDDLALKEIAAAGAGISWIRAGKDSNFAELSDIFLENPELKADLQLEQAISQARLKQEGGMAGLESFLLSYPDHPRINAARLALAEVLLKTNPPDIKRVRRLVEEMKRQRPQNDVDVNSTLSAKQAVKFREISQDRLARLEMMISEASQDWEKLISQAEEYLNQNKNSSDAALVRLKLGEAFFRTGNFHNSLVALQPFIQMIDNPSEQKLDSSVIELGLFLAAKAALQSNTPQSLDQALKLFQKLEQQKGSLQASAMREEVSVLWRMGNPREALNVLKNLKSLENLSDEIKFDAESMEAESWIMLAGEDPKAASQAEMILSKMLDDLENKPLAWKRRISFQRGQLRERAGRQAEALADYYAVVSGEMGQNSDIEREWHWLYQAGFSALRILEDQKNWKGAIAMANRLEKLNGPRSAEAAKRARNLKLEHMIWED